MSPQAELRLETVQMSLLETQARLTAMEAREEELKCSIPEATRPLVEEIASLQAAMKARQSEFEAIEVR